MQLSLIVEDLPEALHPPVRRGARSLFRLQCQTCAAAVQPRSKLCPRCGAPQPVRSLARVAAVAKPFLGLGAVVAVFVLCAHFLGESVSEPRSAGHGNSSTARFDENDPSDISYYYVGQGR